MPSSSLPTRILELEKEVGARMGIGLLENDGVLVCKYIESSSFLCGHLNPGDLITAANGVEAKSAPRIAAECKQVDRVTLHVHSPLPHADHVCFVKPNDRSALGFTVSKDPKTGFAMVAQIAPSAHVRATEPWDLELGERGGLPLALNDLILAVGHGGTSYAVDSPKEANARLKAAAAGALIELRVLRAASSYAVGAEKGALARVPSAPSPASSTRASAVQRIEAPHTKEGPPTITDVDSSFDSSSGSDMGDRSTVCATPLREGAAWAAHLREGGARAAQKLPARRSFWPFSPWKQPARSCASPAKPTTPTPHLVAHLATPAHLAVDGATALGSVTVGGRV